MIFFGRWEVFLRENKNIENTHKPAAKLLRLSKESIDDAGVPAVATGGFEWNSNIPLVPPEFIWQPNKNNKYFTQISHNSLKSFFLLTSSANKIKPTQERVSILKSEKISYKKWSQVGNYNDNERLPNKIRKK